jgi:hypothetical protein
MRHLDQDKPALTAAFVVQFEDSVGGGAYYPARSLRVLTPS